LAASAGDLGSVEAVQILRHDDARQNGLQHA
jgi:hypothetical protein